MPGLGQFFNWLGKGYKDFGDAGHKVVSRAWDSNYDPSQDAMLHPELAPKEPGLEAAAKEPGPQGNSYVDSMRAMANRLNGPLDFEDPYVKNILQHASNHAATMASQRGIRGPLSVRGTQQGYLNSAAQLQQQNQGLGAQLLGQAASADMADKRFKSDQEQREYENAMNQWAMNAQRAHSQGQDWGSGIGAIGGGIAGFGLAALTGGATAPLIPGFIAGGSQLGGGWGGSASGSMYTTPMPTYPRYGVGGSNGSGSRGGY